jgi:prepilin-type N-terminal cleavage/methylation domain-containing protein
MKNSMPRKTAGFTLLEAIIVLVLVGIISAVAGMGIVRGVEGYMFARDNSAMTQKAQLALSRMSRELMEIQTVTAAGGTSIAFSAPMGSVSDNRTIGLDGTAVKIAEGATALSAGDILVDNVAGGGFTLTYTKSDGSAWVPGTDPIKLLARINILLRLIRQDVGGGYLEFTTTVNPRNTGNFNAPVG